MCARFDGGYDMKQFAEQVCVTPLMASLPLPPSRLPPHIPPFLCVMWPTNRFWRVVRTGMKSSGEESNSYAHAVVCVYVFVGSKAAIGIRALERTFTWIIMIQEKRERERERATTQCIKIILILLMKMNIKMKHGKKFVHIFIIIYFLAARMKCNLKSVIKPIHWLLSSHHTSRVCMIEGALSQRVSTGGDGYYIWFLNNKRG